MNWVSGFHTITILKDKYIITKFLSFIYLFSVLRLNLCISYIMMGS